MERNQSPVWHGEEVDEGGEECRTFEGGGETGWDEEYGFGVEAGFFLYILFIYPPLSLHLCLIINMSETDTPPLLANSPTLPTSVSTRSTTSPSLISTPSLALTPLSQSGLTKPGSAASPSPFSLAPTLSTSSPRDNAGPTAYSERGK